jgi:hypothetical protein
MRRRNEIIELTTEKRFPNELQAEKALNISRYYIRISLKKQIPVKGKMFAYYHYGMEIDVLKEMYKGAAIK